MMAYALAYVCWAIVALSAVLAILQLRSALTSVWMLLRGDPLVLLAVDRLGTVFLCLAWLAYGVLAEDWFRSSVSTAMTERQEGSCHPGSSSGPAERKLSARLHTWGLRLLGRRFSMLVAPPVVLFALAYLAERLCRRALAGPR